MKYPEFIPNGVSDPNGLIAAVEVGFADIDIIDLATGKILRRLEDAGKPLMIDGGLLLGWMAQSVSSQLRIFRLEFRSSDSPVQWSPVFELPTWVTPHSVEDVNFSVQLQMGLPGGQNGM